ncbi:MAG: acetyl-CoA carboxylase carboxyltransferase subunit beta [Candidatus Obscuribacter sp.]|jgi:acetyl-CoA carboxylase carboxyl transferase subunit beta|nr:acetyl-CoA carboxylase carboxyltransferase subunit beta [Candidatus Obscuribacter sp.]MBK7837235.1 acetyl-CoA carboxylase carboxyltransferase subunit beta [Candidatus Obscuribacter sp.]MBK9772978.1 acetyl-CoA carboxylase carboxyltransferase subunit beta [Candidatus Obscuribacter sp.]MBP6593265.1 acetyl-CoA carboxylase carboxyltransferase subunit beta [Candidatus Obscuribacter sp.]MDQ5965253.1 Acetyl-coenzyme carboxylase carboxyl transferase subunit beta [Cyanobacteriota bacterium erpe_2018_s
MDLKEWFASRKQRKELQENIKLPLPTEDYCALWRQCFQCQELLYTKDLRANQQVCPKCQYHFRVGALDRVEQLLDEGSFVELDSEMVSTDPLNFVDTEPYKHRQEEASRKSGLKEAVITGVGEIDGQKVALGAMDFGHFGGSMGSVVGEKVTRLAEEAIKQQIPLIVISSSGGARMQEGILSLMQMAKTSSALKSYAEIGGLYISILAEPTYGGVTASFAMLGDIIIAEPGARIGFAGRRVIEQTIRQKLPADFQTAEYLLKHGQIDMLVERLSLKDTLSRLVSYHPIGQKKVDNNKNGTGKPKTTQTVS